MRYPFSWTAFSIFALFVGVVLGLSFYLGSKARSAKGYYAAHGQVGWFVNGIAFAGDYLSAASFLGICGMIAFAGYDGFLYSIGYLAGWVVALFVIALVLRFGSGAEALAWGILFAVMPLSGVFYPVDALPGVLQPVAAVLPPTHAFAAGRALLHDTGMPWRELWLAGLTTLVAAAAAVCFLAWMLRVFRSRGYITRYL